VCCPIVITIPPWAPAPVSSECHVHKTATHMHSMLWWGQLNGANASATKQWSASSHTQLSTVCAHLLLGKCIFPLKWDALIVSESVPMAQRVRSSSCLPHELSSCACYRTSTATPAAILATLAAACPACTSLSAPLHPHWRSHLQGKYAHMMSADHASCSWLHVHCLLLSTTA
jgi:hypothetical protein